MDETALQEQAEAIRKEIDELLKTRATVEELEKVTGEVDEKVKKALDDYEETVRTQVMKLVDKAISDLKPVIDPDTPTIEWTKSEGRKNPDYTADTDVRTLYRTYADRLKAIDELTEIPGAPQSRGIVWTPMTGGNAFRPDIHIEMVTGDSFPVTRVDAVEFEQRANSQADLAKKGGSDEAMTLLETWELLYLLSLPANMDVPEYFSAIETSITRADMKRKGESIYAALRSSVISNAAKSFKFVKTGIADKIPDKDDIMEILADLMALVPSDYLEGAVWHMARSVYSRCRVATSGGTGGEFAFDPALRMVLLYGYPVRINDRMAPGNTANDVSCAFGNFEHGIVLGEREAMTITNNPYTNPGNITFYANSRHKAAIRDTDAVAGLRTQA